MQLPYLPTEQRGCHQLPHLLRMIPPLLPPKISKQLSRWSDSNPGQSTPRMKSNTASYRHKWFSNGSANLQLPYQDSQEFKQMKKKKHFLILNLLKVSYFAALIIICYKLVSGNWIQWLLTRWRPRTRIQTWKYFQPNSSGG